MSARPDDGNRLAMLAKVHVARKQMGLDEPAYRGVLTRVTGHDSAGACDAGALARLLAEFERLGWSPGRSARRDHRGHVRKIWAIWAELRPLLAQADDETLRGFVRRQTRSVKNPDGIGAPEWLDAAEATKVIEGLKGWLARVKQERVP